MSTSCPKLSCSLMIGQEEEESLVGGVVIDFFRFIGPGLAERLQRSTWRWCFLSSQFLPFGQRLAHIST
eukprot:13771-Eustigmatos_ZCMA.PRE.1